MVTGSCPRSRRWAWALPGWNRPAASCGAGPPPFSAPSTTRRIPELTALLHSKLSEVVEPMSLASLPFTDELEMPSIAVVDVRVGGAVLFVVAMEQMQRV